MKHHFLFLIRAFVYLCTNTAFSGFRAFPYPNGFTKAVVTESNGVALCSDVLIETNH